MAGSVGQDSATQSIIEVMGSHGSLIHFLLATKRQVQPGHSQKAVWLGFCAGLIAVIALLVTSPCTPMVWDEGDAILRAERIRDWFGSLFRDEVKGPAALSPQGVARGWPFTTQREGHPAMYGAVIALGRSLAPGCLDPLTQYRLGPILLFSVAMGFVAYRLAQISGPVTAAAAFLCIFLQPRLFAHAHFASFDGPLTAFWMLAWACSPFFPVPSLSSKVVAKARPRSTVAWGIVLGATMSSKATGWFVILPFVIWAIVQRKRAVLWQLVMGILVGLAAFVVFNPPLWFDLLRGCLRFFELNLERHQRPDLNITTFFLGRLYNLDYPLPWYNTLFWTAIAVPIPILLFFVIGLIDWIRTPRRGLLTLIVLHWATLIVVRAIPGTPPHDGIRLFLPAFPFLGILAGYGFHFGTRVLVIQLRQWCKRLAARSIYRQVLRKPQSTQMTNSIQLNRLFRKGNPVLTTGAWIVILSPILSLICFGPQWLSYYNGLIGGLPGAAAAGMEPTYYWDGLDREVFLWLEVHCLETEKVYYSACSWANLRLLQKWGFLNRAFATSPADAQWYVVQNRPSAWSYEDQWLFSHGEAAFVKYPGRGYSCPWVGQVPVVKIFPIREYYRACRAVYGDQADSH